MKTHINIWTFWHVDHWKTTLTAAIVKVLKSKYWFEKDFNFSDIDSLPEEKKRWITIRSSHVWYETDSLSFNHLDCPGHEDYVKNAILGLNQMDYWILVVDSNDWIMNQTKEHVILANQTWIKKILVFLNKCDSNDDEELIDLVEMEVSELLEKYWYTEQDYFIYRWSALYSLNNTNDLDNKYWAKVILEMINKINDFPLPERKEDKNFIMSVEEVFTIKWRWTVITWTPLQWKIKLGEQVDIVNKKNEKPIETTVIWIQQFHKDLNEWIAWTNLWLLVRWVDKDKVVRGNTVVRKRDFKRVKKISALVYFLKEEEGGRHNPVFSNYYSQAFIRNDDIRTKLILPNEKEMILPWDHLEVILEFDFPVILEEWMTFSLREWKRTVWSWKVSKILG